MKRRDFITLFGGATAWPLAARAQQGERMRRIGVLMGIAADDPAGQVRLAAFLQGLQQLGWTEGRNVRIDIRWGAAQSRTCHGIGRARPGRSFLLLYFHVYREPSPLARPAVRHHNRSINDACYGEDRRPLQSIRIAWVFRAAGHLPVVVVDLREERLAGGFEAAKVVLAEPVVVLVEVREVLDLGQLNDPT